MSFRPTGGVVSGGVIVPLPQSSEVEESEFVSSEPITKLGVYGGPTARSSFFGVQTDVTLRETTALSDRLRFFLMDAEGITVRERVGLSDRLTWAMIDTVAVTLRETIGLSDRISGAPIEAIAHTIRETLGLIDRVSGVQQQPYGPAMIALTHIELDEGTENYSGHRVIAPSHTHEPKVISFGSIEKEVEVPSGAPRLSDITIRVDDSPDKTTGIQHFRSTFGAKTPRTRKQDILIGPVGGKESLFLKPARVSIQHVTFPPLAADIHGSDLRFKFLAKPLPNHIHSGNFPNLPVGVTEAFFKLVFGIVSSDGYGNQGALKCIHVDTALHRYDAAFHPIEDAIVYTKTPDEQQFQVTPYSYTLVNEEMIIDDLPYHPTYIQFASALPEGTEVRADIWGVNFRGDWGTLPTVIGPSRNLVDHTINILYYLKRLDEPVPDFSDYDVASFAEVREKVADIPSDYAIVGPLTGQEVITQLHAPAIVFMVPDNHDRIKLVKITDEDFENAPTIDDRTGTLLRTEVISLASPTYNRYLYRRARNYATDQWGAEEVYDNTADQEVLGEVEQLQVDFHSIRDEDAALIQIAERSGWEDQEAHRIRLQLDAKTHLTDIDLLKPFKWTHYGGLATGGWVDELFIPYRVKLVIDKPLIYDIDAIRRPIVVPPIPQIITIGAWTWNSRVGPEYLTTVRRAYLWFADDRFGLKKLVVLGTNADGDFDPADDGVFPMLDNEIGSHDGIFVGTMLHLVTQEKVTGRAAYSRFNGANGQWEILNQTILASNSHGDYGITLDVQEPSGLVTVMLQGDREFSSGFLAFPASGPAGFYQRAYVTTRQSNGTWTTLEMMGDPADAEAQIWFPIWGDPNYNGAVDIHTGRAKAGLANRVHFVFSRVEPGDVASTPDFMVQTLRADGTLSDAYEWEMTVGLGGNSAPFLGGQPERFEDENGDMLIAFPIGKLTEPKLVLWQDVDNPTAPYRIIILSTVEVQPDTFGARWAPIGVKEFDGTLHILHGTRSGATEEWAAYKTLEAPFATAEVEPSYSGSPRDIVAGAIFPNNGYARHGFDIKRLRDGHTYLFKVTSGNFGIQGTNDGKWIFEKIDLDDLPTSYTLAEFLAEQG